MMRLLIGSLLLLNVVVATYCANDDDKSLKNSQVPDLFPLNGDSVSLIAQVVTTNGFETREEITDRKFGKQTILITNDKNSKTLFVDTRRGIIEYMPYSCKKISLNEMESDPAYSGLMTFEQMNLRMYGISAIWMNAKLKPKIWDLISDGVWQTDDPVTKNRIKLVSTLVGDNYVIESVQLFSANEKNEYKMHTMINIISVEKPRHNDLLQVPTGYGCVIDDEPLSLSYLNLPVDYDSRFFALNLEISATKYSPLADGSTSSTDFLGLELVFSANHGLQLMRRKESNRDTKTIVDLSHRVTYELDELRGSCERRHNKRSLDGNTAAGESHFLDTKISFANGLSLDVNVEKLKKLFTDVDNFYLIKVNSPMGGNSRESFHYYEAKVINSDDIVVGYVTRKYYQANTEPQLKLSTVSVRFLSVDHTRIDATYHFNIIDLIDPENAQFNMIANMDQVEPRNPELGRQQLRLAKLFDISEECYLESESQRAGHDYVWIEMSYMLPNQELKSLEEQREALEASLYGQLLSQWQENGFTILRVPKFEVILSLKKDLLIIRLLVLDLPPLNLIFTEVQNLLIEPSREFADTTDFARDLEHCTNLCRLSHCQMLTFGQRDHKCILSRRPPGEHTNKTAEGYKTFYYEKIDDKMFDFDKLTTGNLRMIMRLLQSRQYDDYVIPEKPEAIQRPPGADSDDYSKKEYQEMTDLYWKSLLEAMPSKEDRKMVFRFTAKSGLDHQLVPKNYLFEADPLAEFNFDDADKNNLVDLEENVPTFHQGFPFYTFKSDLDLTRYNAHYFKGVSVEQCELACVDGLCSSYSYCESKNRRECTITSIHQFENVERMEETVGDNDCFIAQRDFLSKYNRFENVLSPQTSGDVIQKYNNINRPECAYQCYINSKEHCLAFDYCIGSAGQDPECFLLRRREIYTGANENSTDHDSKKPDNPDQITGCDHYSRSYLADFWRLEYTEIKPDELAKLNPSTFNGLTVDTCADKCVVEDNKCSGFQFCFMGDNKDVKDETVLTQVCKLIDSPPKEELEIDEDSSGHARKKGSFIIPSPGMNCHLFIMRGDADEAKLRDLAFNGTKPFNPKGGDDDTNSSTGLSVLSGLIIYMSVTVVAAAIGSGFVILKHNNSKFRQRVERFSIWMRVRRS